MRKNRPAGGRGKPRLLGGIRVLGKAEIMSDSVIYIVSIMLLIALAGLAFWIARQSLGLGGMSMFQGKVKRLGVVESTAMDGRRRLLLVRRDNVEHLIMTGGPVDVVIETGIEGHRHLEPPLEDVVIARTEPRPMPDLGKA